MRNHLILLLLPWVVTRWMRGEAFYVLIITCPIKEQVMKTLRLNNGYEIPVVGTGTNTFGKEGKVFSEQSITIPRNYALQLNWDIG
jgi:hypothetical protein